MTVSVLLVKDAYPQATDVGATKKGSPRLSTVLETEIQEIEDVSEADDEEVVYEKKPVRNGLKTKRQSAFGRRHKRRSLVPCLTLKSMAAGKGQSKRATVTEALQDSKGFQQLMKALTQTTVETSPPEVAETSESIEVPDPSPKTQFTALRAALQDSKVIAAALQEHKILEGNAAVAAALQEVKSVTATLQESESSKLALKTLAQKAEKPSRKEIYELPRGNPQTQFASVAAALDDCEKFSRSTRQRPGVAKVAKVQERPRKLEAYGCSRRDLELKVAKAAATAAREYKRLICMAQSASLRLRRRM